MDKLKPEEIFADENIISLSSIIHDEIALLYEERWESHKHVWLDSDRYHNYSNEDIIYAINNLPDKRKSLLILRLVYKYTYKKLAIYFGLSPKSITYVSFLVRQARWNLYRNLRSVKDR